MTVNRGTLNLLLAFAAVAKASGELALEVADHCRQGAIDDVDRDRLRVTVVRLITHTNALEAAL